MIMVKNMRILKTFPLILLICGCGFTPMYSSGLIDIYVPPISGVNGIDLRNALNARFGAVGDTGSEYILTVTLNDPSTKYKALDASGAATWQEISLRANYTLTHNGQRIASGVETASESYTFVRYLVASNASYNNAVQNTITVLADKIGTRAIAATKSNLGK